MDGTLVDTEHQWLATVADFLGEQGIRGRGGEAGGLRRVPAGDAAAKRPGRERVDVGIGHPYGGTTRPGVHRQGPRPASPFGRVPCGCWTGARALGIPPALVTASERRVADLVLRTLGAHRFALSVRRARRRAASRTRTRIWPPPRGWGWIRRTAWRSRTHPPVPRRRWPRAAAAGGADGAGHRPGAPYGRRGLSGGRGPGRTSRSPEWPDARAAEPATGPSTGGRIRVPPTAAPAGPGPGRRTGRPRTGGKDGHPWRGGTVFCCAGGCYLPLAASLSLEPAETFTL